MIQRHAQDKTNNRDIYVSGSVAYDDIMDFPNHFKDYFHPEKLHQINVSFVVTDLAKHLGGIATNISYALRNTQTYYKSLHKGNAYTIFPVASVGKDGDDLLNFFKKNNINTTFVQKDEKLYTATGKVITDMNDNQIWGFYYGASALIPKHSFTKVENGKNDFWILSATHEKPFSTTLRYAINNKLPYMFDPGMTLTWIRDDLLKKGVLNASYVVGNDYEIAMIEKRLGMTVAGMVEKGINVITTLGEKGVRYDGQADVRTTLKVKSFKVRKVVDPTGAGDAWRGGFVGALAACKPIEECLVMGNVMASFAVENVGTVEYQTDEKKITERMRVVANTIKKS